MPRGLVTTRHIIHIDSDFYEVTLRNNVIISIIRHMGELRRSVLFDNLSPLVQQRLLNELTLPTPKHTNGKTT